MRGGTHLPAAAWRTRTGRSKYGNVKVVIDGITFASKREGARYVLLKARQTAGEIEHLHWQVRFPLQCPTRAGFALVAYYVADFEYWDKAAETFVVEDAKGVKTPTYLLKKRWLFLQDGIEIQEV